MPSQPKTKEPERIFKTNEEWQKLLTHEQFMVTRMKATEPAFSGKYAHGHFKGTFLCVCCGARLFDARTQVRVGHRLAQLLEAGEPAGPRDGPGLQRAAEARVEVTCRRCGAHLGHVFQDGPPPTGLRYCINSLALLDRKARRSHSSPQVGAATHGLEVDQKGQALERRHRGRRSQTMQAKVD